MKKYTKNELIAGMEMYLIIAKNEPAKFEEVNDESSISESAEAVVNYLLQLIKDLKS